MSTKESRKENPSGWVTISEAPSLVYIIDALLDLPSDREFNKKELGELAGVSYPSVHTYFDRLEEMGVVKPVEDSEQLYRFDPENDVSQALFELEGAVHHAVDE